MILQLREESIFSL